MSLDVATSLLYQLYSSLELRGFTGMAAPASAKAGLFSSFGQRVEDYLLAFGSARGAGGDAVDASGADGKDEGSIVCVVSGEHCLPIIFFVHIFLHLLLLNAKPYVDMIGY